MPLSIIRLALMLLLTCIGQGARADTEIRLLKSFVGNVNFVGTQKTIRNKANNKPCEVFAPGSGRTATLSGIPSGATIVGAHLYWAGSGATADYTVTLNGEQIKAAADRQYSSATIGSGFTYFAGAADITEQVKKKRNGDYTFGGLTVDYGKPYCAVEGVLGGFSLLVIYSDNNEPLRLLNLYEGLRFTRYNGITLNLSGFRVPDPIGTATGRIAHITWEGDASIDGSGESLIFNNYQMTDKNNPAGNQFNSMSSINGDEKSFGIDFDGYTVGSPVIKPGDTTASTRYESGQDLVLLNAEIVALPNIPMADLGIELTRNNAMAFGQDVGYSVAVTNNGPSVAAAPTVVTNTLPPELKFVSAAGSGWSCTAAGQEVKCSHNGSLAVGASLPVLTITANVIGKGAIVNSVAVTGKVFDHELANNAASTKDTVAGESAFVLTNGECKDGLPFADANQSCTELLPTVKAGVDSPIFITALAGGVPAKISADKVTTVNMSFAFSCHKPARTAGVTASFAGMALKVCAANGDEPTEWSSPKAISFSAGSPSAAAMFRYDDVGRIQLYLKADGASEVGTAPPFVSVPYEIRLTYKGARPSAIPLLESAPAFMRAGQPFEVEIGSYNSRNILTPNFGVEGIGAFDMPSVGQGAPPGSPATGAMTSIPKLGGTIGPVSGGGAVGSFSWSEVGVIKLTPKLLRAQYLGLAVTETPAYFGRFYPHHFLTSATQMDCLPDMGCDNIDVSTAAYSKQPLSVKITASSAGGTPTLNYQGVFARDLQLSAWEKPKLATGNLGGLSENLVASGAFKDGAALASPVFTLANGYVHTAPQGPWNAPTRIFLRADETTGSDKVSSLDFSELYEVGIQVLSGRLLVPNAHGSERLDLPLKLSAQYWTGSNWELSRNDSQSIVVPGAAVFSRPLGALAGSTPGLAPPTAQTMAAGMAGVGVKLSPAAAGSIDLLINGIPWLPSTKGRLKFGTPKSPLIYMREVH